MRAPPLLNSMQNPLTYYLQWVFFPSSRSLLPGPFRASSNQGVGVFGGNPAWIANHHNDIRRDAPHDDRWIKPSIPIPMYHQSYHMCIDNQGDGCLWHLFLCLFSLHLSLPLHLPHTLIRGPSRIPKRIGKIQDGFETAHWQLTVRVAEGRQSYAECLFISPPHRVGWDHDYIGHDIYRRWWWWWWRSDEPPTIILWSFSIFWFSSTTLIYTNVPLLCRGAQPTCN